MTGRQPTPRALRAETGLGTKTLARVLPPAALALIMWVSELIDTLLGGFLDRFGIQPRDPDALAGILAAPFLHADLAHLIANTGTFLVLGGAIALLTRRFWAVTLGVTVLGGLAVWLTGAPNTVHIGASGLVYGYFAFLLCYGFAARRVSAIAVAVLAFALYGGIVWGVLPGESGVSWQGHLFGAVAGALLALGLGRRDRRPPARTVSLAPGRWYPRPASGARRRRTATPPAWTSPGSRPWSRSGWPG